jgi:hypothetical protein
VLARLVTVLRAYFRRVPAPSSVREVLEEAEAELREKEGA